MINSEGIGLKKRAVDFALAPMFNGFVRTFNIRIAGVVAWFTFLGGFAGNYALAKTVDFSAVVLKIPPDSAMIGVSLSHARFFSQAAGDGFREISWQMDRLNTSGFPAEATDQVVAQDELIVLPEDLGLKINEGEKKKYAGRWVELEIERDGARSWIYVLEAKELPETKVKDYVFYNDKEDSVRTPSYQVGFRNIANAKYITWSNADGSAGENLLREISVVFRTRFLFGLIPLKVDSEELLHEQVAVRDGPLRFVKRVETRLRLPFGIRIEPQVIDYYFYRDTFYHEVRIKIPESGKILLSHARFRITLGLLPRTKPSELVLAGGGRFKLDATTPPGVTVLQEERPSWVGFLAEDVPRMLVTYLHIPESERDVFVPQALTFEKTAQGGNLASTVLQEMRRGNHRFSLHVFVLPKEAGLKPHEEISAEIARYFSSSARL